MLAYAAGDVAAFEQLYALHRRALFQFLLNSCGNEAIAREHYQDVWLRVVKNRSSFQPGTPFNAWLYRIARHRVIDHYRAQKRVPPITAASEMDDTYTNVSSLFAMPLMPDEIASLTQRSDSLSEALQLLPDVQREAVLLRHIAGMSVSEVASVVDVGVETVKSRLRYAVVKLRSTLQEYS